MGWSANLLQRFVCGFMNKHKRPSKLANQATLIPSGIVVEFHICKDLNELIRSSFLGFFLFPLTYNLRHPFGLLKLFERFIAAPIERIAVFVVFQLIKLVRLCLLEKIWIRLL